MNQDSVKSMLLNLENTELEFSVIFSGKSSTKVNGLYNVEEREIILHNKNFKTDNQLIYTAIHEYTHHLINEKYGASASGRPHNAEFFSKMHSLLDKAEEQGIYSLGLESSPELEKLTQEIKTNYIEQNGRLMMEFGRMLQKAAKLCEEANIRYDDYLDRVLRLPRTAEKSIKKVSNLDVNPAIGFENMKLLSSITKPEQREEMKKELESGKTPDTVRAMMKKKALNVDKKSELEKEKVRLEKTIENLKQRLIRVEGDLAEL